MAKKLNQTGAPNAESLFCKARTFNGGRIQVQFNKAAEDAEPATIQIYEDIGEDPWSGQGMTAKDFSDALADIPRGKALDLRINSAGGSVWEGMAIKALLDEWPGRKTASIDGMAASVASWLPMAVDEIRAPKHAQMFIHDAWAIVAGNSGDLRKTADDLDKTSGQIADMYARKTGMSSGEAREMMKVETLMTAEEAHELGFIDRLTDEEAVANFTEKQIANMKNRLAVLRNSLAPSKQQGGATNQPKGNTVNKEQKIALLNKWGVEIPKDATEDQLDSLIEAGKPGGNPKGRKNKKNAGKCDGEMEDDAADGDGDDDDEGKEGKAKNKAIQNALDAAKRAEVAAKALEEQAKNQLRTTTTNRVKALVEADKVPAGQMNEWIEDAVNAADPEKVLNRLESLPSRPPGTAPLNITVGESSSVDDLNRAVNQHLEPSRYLFRNRRQGDEEDRRVIGANARSLSNLINRLKKYDSAGNMAGPLREMWDGWAASPRNANTMSTDLLRQVILSEVMRAFRREFTSLSFFAHTFQNVPLEGNDYVKVPYYPLDTTASSEFKYATGYAITPGSVTSSKSILVGGKGDGTATAGSGRKYKGLQFSAYEIRRQPWLDIQKLTILAGEQLAVDVRADIIGTNINATNFGNAIWSGASGGFDHTVVTQYLQNAAIKAFWPTGGRNVVVAPDYYTALASDPGITPYLSIGTTELIRQGVIGGLYGFENILADALLPVANYIRGGDGTVTAGADTNLAGYMCWPSAVLVATAPIMPPPGVLKKLLAYEQVTDDQTGLSFTYQYWGDESANADNEIIECTYGSGLGELAALKRFTSSGN